MGRCGKRPYQKGIMERIRNISSWKGCAARDRLKPGLHTLITTTASAVLLLSACDKKAESGESMKVRVGYIGLTCEAPIFTAVEKGFFKEEGLDVSLVRCEWANYKDVLALGGYDVTHHLVMYFLKPVEQGLDVKFTGGIHRGCLRVQAATKGNINMIKDLGEM